ncbi:unnamed protein product [Adineta ricciae]|uniref:Major facilitator superfamily (MFS) profile domain-containing protein n=1 Tax=Adineta ricciae TaxID=249248 RepID=A0A815Q9A4_ADIRI|nr:unnamed protein product [Adineta ricciae]CAF1639332.1 unnamed protein product [Adineta ricciae]
MAIFVSIFAALGGFLYGYDTGLISGIINIPYFLQTYGHRQGDTTTYVLESSDKSLIVSILSAGTFIGALLGYPSSDYLGRRRGLILAYLIFSVGVILQIIIEQFHAFIFGRFITGLGLGIVSCILPIYQSECAPKQIRGALVSTYQLCITLGLLVAAVVNNQTKDRTSSDAYRIPIGLQLLWAAILCIGMFILPESPRYLILKGHVDQAYQSQSRLTSKKIDDPQVTSHIKEMIVDTAAAKAQQTGTYLDCFRLGPDKTLWRTLGGIFLQVWQQLSGINFIFYYGTTFFHSSGMAHPFLLTIIINLVNVIMTIPGLLLIDLLGRRKLLIIGACGMCLCEYSIALIGQSNETKQKLLIVFVCIYIAFFASTWGPSTSVITGELYPTCIRAKCMSLSTASNWLTNFMLGCITPYLIDADKGNLGTDVFFIWGTTCLGCVLFGFFCVWETSGLSLEKINYLIRNSSPITSVELNQRMRSSGIIENEVLNNESIQLLDKS